MSANTTHSLLGRQIKRHFGGGGPPGSLAGFIAAVDEAYRNFDEDRAMLERSLELSSQELLQANLEMRSVLRAFPDIYFRVDAEGRILDCKGGGPEDYFLPAETLVGKRLQDVPGHEAGRLIEAAVESVRGTGQPASVEYPISLGGTLRHYEARLIPLLGGEIFGIVRNITGRKELETRLVQSEKLSAVGRLAAGVAHEINNPLGVILGFAQAAVKRVPEDHPLSLAVRSIEREALRCKRLVVNLLAFSRRRKARSERFDPSQVAAEALSIIEAECRLRSVALVKALEPVPGFVGDPGELQQVVVNLCDNAIDALPGGGKIVVRCGPDPAGGPAAMVLEVADDGTGIPEGVRDRIFDPFFTTKDVGQGTGLGLSLVYEIVHRHGGTITVRSGSGAGTTFLVALPSGTL